jgi:hypothetical protein
MRTLIYCCGPLEVTLWCRGTLHLKHQWTANRQCSIVRDEIHSNFVYIRYSYITHRPVVTYMDYVGGKKM